MKEPLRGGGDLNCRATVLALACALRGMRQLASSTGLLAFELLLGGSGVTHGFRGSNGVKKRGSEVA